MDLNQIYKEEWNTAVGRTIAEGYSVNTFGTLNKVAYDLNAYHAFMSSFSKIYSKSNGNFDLSMIKGRCLEVHVRMQSNMKEQYNIDSVLTIGYVTKLGQDMFKFDNIAELPSHLTMEGKPSLNFHVWLTLPSFQILDFTFIVHFEYTNSPEHIRRALMDAPSYIANFGSASEIYNEEQMTYHPLYVGKDALVKSGLIK